MPKISRNPHAELRQLFYTPFYCVFMVFESKVVLEMIRIKTFVHRYIQKASNHCEHIDRSDLCNLITFLILFCHESSSHNFSPYIDPIWFLDTFHLPFSFSPEKSEIQFMFIHIKSLTWCLGSLTSVFNQKKCVVNLKKKIKCKSLKEF